MRCWTHDRISARRAALVLTASQGLGRESAESLATAGFDVVVCSRTEAGVAATVTALEDIGAPASGIPNDVTIAGESEALFASADATFGSLDVLVTSAGAPPAGGCNRLDDEA